MSKARKYYGIFKMVSESPSVQTMGINGLTQVNINITTDRTVLEVAHEIAFKTKKESIDELSKFPYPSMLTIIEFYLILKE